MQDIEVAIIFDTYYYEWMAVADLLAAGTDTISVTLSWLIAILSHQPEVQKKLHEEIDTFVNAHGRLPTFEERDQVPYLVCVQKECMRYRSTSSFGLPHTTREDGKYKTHIAGRSLHDS